MWGKARKSNETRASVFKNKNSRYGEKLYNLYRTTSINPGYHQHVCNKNKKRITSAKHLVDL